MATASTPTRPKLLADLKRTAHRPTSSTLGDSFLLPHEFADESQSAVAAQFGPEFAGQLDRLKTGEWTGPIRSGYGVHLVLLTARTEGRLPALDEVRELVKRDLMSERRLEANRRFLDGLLAQYKVKIEWPKADSVSTRQNEGAHPMKRLLLILAVCGAFALIASAHEVRPAYLELRETAPDTYDILWKVPARGGDERLGIYVRLPADTEQLAEPRGVSAGGAYLERWRVRRSGGLAGQTISIDGLAATGTDVLVRVEHADGSTQTTRLLPSQPSFVVEAAPSRWHSGGNVPAAGR